MSTGKKEPTLRVVPEIINPSLPFNEAIHSLMALTQLLGSLQAPDGSAPGATPMIILTAAGIEMRMSDAAPVARAAQPDQEWVRKIEEGLESVRQATAALSASFGENVKNIDQTLASHAEAIESVRAALTQNEQLMESMVELMGPSDFALPNPEEFANIS